MWKGGVFIFWQGAYLLNRKRYQKSAKVTKGKQIGVKLEAGGGTHGECMEEDVNQELHSIKLPLRSSLFIVQNEKESSYYGVLVEALICLVKMTRPLELPLICYPAWISIIFIPFSSFL